MLHSPTETLSAHITLFSKSHLWRHKLCFSISPEIAPGDGHKNSRIRVKTYPLSNISVSGQVLKYKLTS